MFKPTLLFIACTAISGTAFSQQVAVDVRTQGAASVQGNSDYTRAQASGSGQAEARGEQSAGVSAERNVAGGTQTEQQALASPDAASVADASSDSAAGVAANATVLANQSVASTQRVGQALQGRVSTGAQTVAGVSRQTTGNAVAEAQGAINQAEALVDSQTVPAQVSVGLDQSLSTELDAAVAEQVNTAVASAVDGVVAATVNDSVSAAVDAAVDAAVNASITDTLSQQL
ncbi:hypothetical protein [Simiduia agarivorans]|uniref:Cell wall surface anchor family protein n=1 Tax=Simiduia agarivorans (strain DSM 21679 / JCM 13881 / BCRC 17597 / SA1) TaxID=1117647 RepID=K4KMS3_SIMAS|nr:hypothetical protein [Simiduia agarivorans]AFV00475.1 hypothetical protein M5M_16720 [Simiduia agarivorans SA1 = DSM 21679]